MRWLTPLLALAALLVAPAAHAHHGATLAEELVVLFELGDDYAAELPPLVGDSAVTDAALDALSTHPDYRVRTQASIVLGWRTTPDLYTAIWSAEATPDRRRVRLRFVDEVFLDPAAAPAVVERVLHGGDEPLAQAGLVLSLFRVGEDWDGHLLGLLGQVEHADVRAMAVWGLRQAEPATARAGLRIALQDHDPAVRAEAARSIGWRADGADLVPELLETLSDEDAHTRGQAARALGWLEAAEAAPELASLTADADAEVRLHALRALDRVDPLAARTLPGLRGLASDPSPKVSRVAGRILKR